jgi:hypothetical protein
MKRFIISSITESTLSMDIPRREQVASACARRRAGSFRSLSQEKRPIAAAYLIENLLGWGHDQEPFRHLGHLLFILQENAFDIVKKSYQKT